MRPINSMVEFKQIVGRGTRLFDGKDFFTIYDFVDAHNHFNDDEWDGEPLDPEQPIYKPETIDDKSGINDLNSVCPVCGEYPCTCEGPQRRMIRVKLSDNKIRELDSMVKTTFWNPTGTPISAEEFVRQLFGDIPAFFKDENELRKLWSNPNTRKELLNKLSEKGYSINQLEELKKLVHGEDSDLYDVLAYVAYHRNMVPRFCRAEKAKSCLESYNDKQQDFLNFVLEQYVKEGVGELDVDKLPYLLTLKYKSVTDGINALGDVSTIRNAFIDFQECLYQPIAIY
jgi:type I restriction enzyme R subunit